MKLAQALQERSDLQKRIQQLRSRLNQNATVQEGEQPAENPAVLITEFENCAARLEELIGRINRTNSETLLADGTLTQLLAKRDCLKLRVETYREFLSEASYLAPRATRTEIKIYSTVSVTEHQKMVDRLSRELRELDAAIQEANWTTELL